MKYIVGKVKSIYLLSLQTRSKEGGHVDIEHIFTSKHLALSES